MNTPSQQWQQIADMVHKKIVECYPDYVLVDMSDKVTGDELDKRYNEIREELEQYQLHSECSSSHLE